MTRRRGLRNGPGRRARGRHGGGRRGDRSQERLVTRPLGMHQPLEYPLRAKAGTTTSIATPAY
jgi:hypothetical protein